MASHPLTPPGPPDPPLAPGPPTAPGQRVQAPGKPAQADPRFTSADFHMFSQIGADNLLTPRKPRAGKNPGDSTTTPAPAEITIGTRTVQINDLPVTDYSPEWWFMYFWKEASARVSSATAQEKQRVLEFFNKAFIKPPKFGLGNDWVIPRGPFLTGTPPPFAADELRGYLTAMLKIGFDWIALDVNGDLGASSDAMLAYADMAGRTVHYQLVWRGESRRGLTELRQKGYDTQARDGERSRTIRTGEPWHPFSENEIRSKLWYRTGQNDNCLYSTVSVATDWRASVCFPKIEQTTDLSAIQNAFVNQKQTLGSLVQQYPTRIGKVLFLNGKTEDRLITTSKVALMAVEGMFLKTQERQEDTQIGKGPGTGYPELGVSSIAGSNVFAMVEFVRIHHGVTDDDGFTALTRLSKSQMVTRDKLVMAFVDDKARTDYYGTIEAAYKSAAKFVPRGFKWTTTGFNEIEALKGVREVRVENNRLWPS